MYLLDARAESDLDVFCVAIVRDAQDRLLWRDKTSPAPTYLIMSWKAFNNKNDNYHYHHCVIMTITAGGLYIAWSPHMLKRCSGKTKEEFTRNSGMTVLAHEGLTLSAM